MTATFWTGSSLTFTNGSDTVTVNTGASLDSVKPNSSLKAGNYNEPVEIKSVNGNVITLFENWPGSTGNTSATITPSAATAASAGASAQALITQIQTLVNSASVTATANSFVKRDSSGRLKVSAPSANDDAVNKGFLGDVATKNSGTTNGNVMLVGSTSITDFNDVPIDQGFMRADPSVSNQPSTIGANNWAGIHVERFDTSFFDLWAALTENRYFARAYNGDYRNWVEFFHSDRLVHAQNSSGGSIASNSTISGANLTPAKAGTWRNVSGASISANNYGLWMAV